MRTQVLILLVLLSMWRIFSPLLLSRFFPLFLAFESLSILYLDVDLFAFELLWHHFKNQIWPVVCHHPSFFPPASLSFSSASQFIYVCVPDVVLWVSELLFFFHLFFLFLRLCTFYDPYSCSLICYSAISNLLLSISNLFLFFYFAP